MASCAPSPSPPRSDNYFHTELRRWGTLHTAFLAPQADGGASKANSGGGWGQGGEGSIGSLGEGGNLKAKKGSESDT